MRVSRRRLVRSFAAGAGVCTSGCLDALGRGSGVDESQYTPVELTRCRGESVTVEHAVTSNATAEDWGPADTAEVARQRAVDVAESRLGAELVHGKEHRQSTATSASLESTATPTSWIVTLAVRVWFGQDGKRIGTPTAPFSDLLAQAPRSVTVHLTVPEESLSRSVPVFASFEKVFRS